MALFQVEVLSAALGSIVAITSLAALVRKPTSKLCPICVGVSLTWAWLLLVWWFSGWGDLVVIGILMGGSVVGFAYTVGKKIHDSARNRWWKAVIVPIGFAAVFGVLGQMWLLSGGAMIVGLAMIFVFARERRSAALSPAAEARLDSHEKARQALENKMDDCC